MILKSKSEDERIEIFFNSITDKSSAYVLIPDKKGVIQVNNIQLSDVDNLIDILQKFKNLMINTLGSDSLK